MEKTKYAGAYYRIPQDNPSEKTYYIMYRRGGRESKLIKDPMGKASQGMTAAKANIIRSDRMAKKELSNTERRAQVIAEKKVVENHYSLERIWQIYAQENAHKSCIKSDSSNIQRLSPLMQKTPQEITKQDVENLASDLKTQISAQTKKPLSAQTQKTCPRFAPPFAGLCRRKRIV